MEFDQFSIALSMLRPDAPEQNNEAADTLQDAHLAHLAKLHEAGYLLAAGPLDDPEYRGLSILSVEPERARELKEQDPAVRAGRLAVKIIPWMVPAGTISFSSGRLPRSSAEATATDRSAAQARSQLQAQHAVQPSSESRPGRLRLRHDSRRRRLRSASSDGR